MVKSRRNKTGGNQASHGASSGRIPGIDGVRAFAALSVMMAHIVGPAFPDVLRRIVPGIGETATFSRYIFTGSPAVVAFFVVSGFCIHYPYVNRPLPVTSFLIARATRIMIPVAAAMAIARWINVPGFNLVEGFILWSIVCELFYYMLYPLFLALTRRVSWNVQLTVSYIAAYAVIIAHGSDQYGNAHIYGPYLNWLAALPSWLLGCVLAERIASDPPRLSTASVWVWRVATALTASVLFWMTMNTRAGYYLTLNVFAVLVFFWIRAEIQSARGRQVSFWDWIGTWSYSIYLFHILVVTLTNRWLRFQPRQLVMFVIPATLLGCYLAYIIVERPSHRFARFIFRTLKTYPPSVQVQNGR